MVYRAIVLLLSALVIWASIAESLPAGTAGAAAMRQDEAIPMPDFGSLPEGVLFEGLAGGIVTAIPAGAPRILLERIELAAEAPPIHRTAAGPEILLVESGQILVSDELGIEGAYPVDSQLFLVAGVPYGVRVGGRAPAVLLRLSVQSAPLATPASTGGVNDGGATPTSEVLADLPVGDDLNAPAVLFLARGAWNPGADLGVHTFSGPVALIAEEGTLSVSGPSGIEGELSDGQTVAFPAGVVNRQWNMDAEPATALLAGITAADAQLVLADARSNGQGSLEAEAEATGVVDASVPEPSATASLSSNQNGFAGNPIERWRVPVAPSNRVTVELIQDGMVLAAAQVEDDSRSTLYAVDATTGQVEWEVSRPNRFDTVKLDSGVVLVEAYDVELEDQGMLYAFDVLTGDELWNFDSGDQFGAPFDVANGVVYASYGENDRRRAALIALDSRSGVEEWRLAPGADWIGGSQGHDPVVDSGRVYVSNSIDSGGTLYALDAAPGRELWSYDARDAGEIYDLIGETIYFVTHGEDDTEVLHALSSSSGAELWTYETDEELIRNFVEDDERVYFDAGTRLESDTLYCLDKRTGVVLWRVNPLRESVSAPVVANGLVVTGSYLDRGGAALYALDIETGVVRWQFRRGEFDSISSPVVVGDVLIVGTGSTTRRAAELIALDATTGDELWSFATNTDFVFTPEVVDGHVYAGTISRRDAAVIAIKGEDTG